MLALERPLTTRHCADYMGVSTQWIRRAIVAGVTIDGGVTVKLAAECLVVSSRTTYRIPEDGFHDFLRAIGCKHLPARLGPGRPVAHEVIGPSVGRPA